MNTLKELIPGICAEDFEEEMAADSDSRNTEPTQEGAPDIEEAGPTPSSSKGATIKLSRKLRSMLKQRQEEERGRLESQLLEEENQLVAALQREKRILQQNNEEEENKENQAPEPERKRCKNSQEEGLAWQCGYCKKTFKHKNHLYRHQRNICHPTHSGCPRVIVTVQNDD